MKLTKIGVIIASLFCVFTFYINVYAIPGDLDSTFDFDGKTVTSIGGSDVAQAVAIQSDGKIVAIGYTGGYVGGVFENDVSLVRYNSDGSLDTGFGTGGKVLLPESGNQRANCLAIQTDGKILVAGDDQDKLAVYRFATDGTLDLTFGSSGKFVFNLLNGSVGNDVVLQPDGKIVIAGTVSVTGALFCVFRLNVNGTLDTSFNSVGYKNVQGGDTNGAIANAVALQTDGKIIVGGNDTYGFGGFWARFNSDGTLDGGSNLLTSTVLIKDIAIQNDGKIVFAGYVYTGGVSYKDFAITRFNANKTLDSTFGNFGVNTVEWGMQRSNEATSLIIQPSGRIVVGGFAVFQNFDFVLARFNSSGFLDVGFGNNGKVTTEIGGMFERMTDLAQQPDGKIVAVGHDLTDFLAARYDGSNSSTLANRTPFDYDGDGRADVSVFRPSTNIWYHLFSSNLSVGVRTFGANGDLPAPADYDGDGRTDFAIFRSSTGTWWFLSSVNNIVNSVPLGQSGDIPRPSDFDGDGKADLVVYRPSNSVWSRRGTTGLRVDTTFGIAGDKPLVGDFDGDGKGDLAIFRPSTGDWWYAASSAGGQHRAGHWGISTDIPVPADYDGDGKTDLAVYRASTGVWYIYNSSNSSSTILAFGLAEDKPVAADYDGDGKADIAVFRPSTGIWYLLQTTAGFGAVQWGTAGDIATENAFIP